MIWLSGCIGDRDHAAEFRKAESAQHAGDFKASLAIAREGLQGSAGDWGWKFRLMCAEDLIALGDRKEATALLQTAGRPSGASLQARRTMDLARTALNVQQREKGTALMREALQAALASGDADLVTNIQLRLGELVMPLAESDRYTRTALAAAEQSHNCLLLSWAQLDLGFNRARFARFDEAVPFLDEAMKIARPCSAKSMLAIASGNLGWCYYMLGDMDRAKNAFTFAETLTGQLGMKDSQHRWLGALGAIYLQRGDLDRAASYQQRAAALARDAGNQAWLAIALTNLAEISLTRGDLAAARSFDDRSLVIKRSLGDEWSLAYSENIAAAIEFKARDYKRAEDGYEEVIQQAPLAHAPDTLWQAYGGLADIYRETGRPKLAEVHYRKAIDTIDREWNNLGSDEWKTTFLAPAALIGFFQDYVDFLIGQGENGKALEVAESSRARVLNQRLGIRGAVTSTFRPSALVAAAQKSHTVLLSYWLAPRRSFVWVIASGRISRLELPPAKAIAGLVEKHNSLVSQAGDPLARNDAASSALYKAVLDPVYKLIPSGSNVVIVPDGALHQLAFGTVVVPGPNPHYWIEDVAISMAPSLRALQAGGGRRKDVVPKLLLIGDPILHGQEFAPLQNIAQEIAAVEEPFQPGNRVVLTGARAVPGEYAKASPMSFEYIHFATHSTANVESPMNSAIILSREGENYKLYARDVAGLPLHAELVTLSACQSAGAKAYSGEGLMGFAWAFLQAGAQNVIATQWDESSDVSADLMRVLYRQIAAGQSPARALRAAKLELMHSAPRRRLPYYWGPLQVFTRRIGP